MTTTTTSLEVSLDQDNVVEDGLRIMRCIRPSWKQEEISHQVFHAGYLNQIVCYYVKAHTNSVATNRAITQPDDVMRDGVVLRVFGDLVTEGVNRLHEVMAMQLANAAGVFPHIEAIFQNGVAYQYASGSSLTYDKYMDPIFIRLLGRSTAQLHCVDYTNTQVMGMDGKVRTWPHDERPFESLDRLVEAIPEVVEGEERNKRYQKLMISKPAAREEMHYLREYFKELDFEKVFGHGDMHGLNTIYDEQKGHVCFVDYEFSGMTYAFDDLAVASSIHDLTCLAGWTKTDERYMSEDMTRLLLRSYLERKCELRGQAPDVHVTEHVLDLAMVEHEMFSIFIHWDRTLVFYNIAVPTMCKDIDFVDYLDVSQGIYFRRKPELNSLKQKYIAIRDGINGHKHK